MDKELLEKIEEIYDCNIVLNQFYNDISELFFKCGQNSDNKQKIISLINESKEDYLVIYTKLRSVKNFFSLSGKQ